MAGMPVGSFRFAIQGHLGSNEIFEVTFCESGGAGLNLAALQDLTDDVRDQFQLHLLPVIATILDSSSGYDRVVGYQFTEGGTRADSTAVSPITSGAGTGSNPLAYQLALCSTLRTAHAGRSYRGRMYWPCDSAAVSSPGLLPSAKVDDIADAIGTFFDECNNHDSGTRFVVVASTTLSVATPVTQVTVDNRLDVQRRRAASQGSTHTGTANLA